MTPTQRERIAAHGRKLLAIFPNATERDPLELCKALRRIERGAHRMAEDYCNGKIGERAWSNGEDRVLLAVQKILRPANDVPIFVNSDPRGYALKIQDTWMREHGAELETDWGGYGILAPEITL